MPIYRKVNEDFFKIWSSEMAYVLGFIFADGSLDTNPRGSSYLSIQITDRDLLKKIRKVMDSNHTIATRIRKRNTESTQYRLQVGRKSFCKNLMEHGMTSNKAKTMTLPAIPPPYRNDFIRGYFDGDGNVWSGYVGKNRKSPTKILQVAFTSCSHSFLHSLLCLLRDLGVEKGSVYRSSTGRFSRLQIYNKDALKIYKMMYNTETSLFLKRKKVVFEAFMRP